MIKPRLDETEELYKLLVGNIKDYAIFALDTEGNIVTWNKGAEKIKGYKAKEIIGSNFSVFYSSEDLDNNFPQYELKEALEHGRFEDEGWRLRKDGSRFWANVIITALFDGDVHIGFAKITRDLTERKKSEELLAQTEETNRLLIESAVDYAIIMLDTSGFIIKWNKGAERLFRFTEREIKGKHVSTFYHEKMRKDYPEMELREALTKGRFEDEDWRVRKDRSQFWANVILTPIYDSKEILIGYAKIVRDLTERKNAEDEIKEMNAKLSLANTELYSANTALIETNSQLQRVNKELDSFIYTASHQLRSPISNIESIVSIFNKEITWVKEHSDLLKMLMDSLEYLKYTVSKLSVINEIHKEAKQTENVNFREVFREIEENLHLNNESLIKYDVKVEDICYSKLNLRTILWNLVSNSLKFKSESRKLKIKISVEQADNKLIKIVVEDNGMGMSKSQTNNLFNIFKRFHTHVEGAGIGLYIVKSLVESSGGYIEVESELDKGTAFKVYVPYC